VTVLSCQQKPGSSTFGADIVLGEALELHKILKQNVIKKLPVNKGKAIKPVVLQSIGS
jgi:hypothetical protein